MKGFGFHLKHTGRVHPGEMHLYSEKIPPAAVWGSTGNFCYLPVGLISGVLITGQLVLSDPLHWDPTSSNSSPTST